jgi:hypothetical protein
MACALEGRLGSAADHHVLDGPPANLSQVGYQAAAAAAARRPGPGPGPACDR